MYYFIIIITIATTTINCLCNKSDPRECHTLKEVVKCFVNLRFYWYTIDWLVEYYTDKMENMLGTGPYTGQILNGISIKSEVTTTLKMFLHGTVVKTYIDLQ